MMLYLIIILMALKCKHHKVGKYIKMAPCICYYIPGIKCNTQFYTCSSSLSVPGLNDKGSDVLHHEYETEMLTFLSSEFK